MSSEGLPDESAIKLRERELGPKLHPQHRTAHITEPMHNTILMQTTKTAQGYVHLPSKVP